MSVHAAKVNSIPGPDFSFARLCGFHDAGRSLNPIIVEGQVIGGVVDGIGGAMFSEMVYDDVAQLLTGSLRRLSCGDCCRNPTHPPDFHGDASDDQSSGCARNWRRWYNSRGAPLSKRASPHHRPKEDGT